jgi:hypothetical protein
MAKLMYTLKLDDKSPSLDQVKRKLDLADDDVDPSFGVVNVDPRENLYAILVDEKAAAKLDRSDAVEGPFSNPKIETFGPPKS